MYLYKYRPRRLPKMNNPFFPLLPASIFTLSVVLKSLSLTTFTTNLSYRKCLVLGPSMDSCLKWLRRSYHGKVKGLKWIRCNQELATPIYRLHPELVQDLARNFLEPFEAALLALCSKRFSHLLGT